MKKILYTVLVLTVLVSGAFAKNYSMKVYEEVPTVFVEVKDNNFDIRVMYGFVKLYQENKNFDLGQVIVKVADTKSENIKVIVRKDDLEKLVNRDVDYNQFIKEYAKFI